MRALWIGLVLVAARILGGIETASPVSAWWAIAFIWHDLATALGFWLLDRVCRHSSILWIPYFTLVAGAAINVGVVRALGSSLTFPMLLATGGALSASIWHYAAPGNLLAIGLVIVIGVAGFVVVRRCGRRAAREPRRLRLLRVAGIAIGGAIVAGGPIAMPHVDTHGRHRNVLTSLVASAMPRLAAGSMTRIDWRLSPLRAAGLAPVSADARERDADLRSLRGAGRGLNVLVVALESTASGYLSSYGAADDPTPRLTAFARHAVQFDRAYAVYPESIKGLFSTLCSSAPAFDESAEVHAASPCTPLARALGAHGYRTALLHSGRFGYLGMKAVVDRQGFEVAEDAGAIGGLIESSFGVDEPSTVRRLLSWIDSVPRSQPFFAMYLPIAGHHPYATSGPGPFGGAGDFVAYKNALYEGDQALGALLDGLKARQLDDRTVVVIYGDHGEAFGQHPGNYAHSLFIYDENVRVPLFVSVPRVTVAPRRIGRVASLLDLTPTLLDLLGLQIPAEFQGRSLLDEGDPVALFYTDYSSPWLGLQDGCTKYLFDMDGERDHLFDTCQDPGESTDLAAGRVGQSQAYRRHVRDWAASAKAAVVGKGMHPE